MDPEGYAYITKRLSELANGKIVIALEGGYNLDSISKSAEACVRSLFNEKLPYNVSLEKKNFKQLKDDCTPLLINYLLA